MSPQGKKKIERVNVVIFFSKIRAAWNEKLFESSRMLLTICIFILLVMRTAKIRPTLTDGSFQSLELEIVMQRAEQSQLLELG